MYCSTIAVYYSTFVMYYSTISLYYSTFVMYSSVITLYYSTISLYSSTIVMYYILLFPLFQIGFSAADAVTGLKLIEKGVPKTQLAMLAIPMMPLQIVLPWVISKYTAGPRPLDVFVKVSFTIGCKTFFFDLKKRLEFLLFVIDVFKML